MKDIGMKRKEKEQKKEKNVETQEQIKQEMQEKRKPKKIRKKTVERNVQNILKKSQSNCVCIIMKPKATSKYQRRIVKGKPWNLNYLDLQTPKKHQKFGIG